MNFEFILTVRRGEESHGCAVSRKERKEAKAQRNNFEFCPD
jgi:hypothetical protein